MIKRITCLHISKLTLLGKVIKTVLHTKEQGCTYKWWKHTWKHTWKPWPRLPSAPSTLQPPLSICKAFLRPKGVTQIYKRYHALQQKVIALERDLGMAQVLWGDAWGRKQNRGKGKIRVTRGETSLGKSGLWWQAGQVTCGQAEDQHVCPAVPCLSCQTVNLLLHLFLGPLFGSHVHLQDMESDYRSQGLVAAWCQQSRVWASAGLGIITPSTKLDWSANCRAALELGQDTRAEWGSWESWLLEERRRVQSELLENLWCLRLAAEHVHKRQRGINRPKSTRVECMPKPSKWKDS